MKAIQALGLFESARKLSGHGALLAPADFRAVREILGGNESATERAQMAGQAIGYCWEEASRQEKEDNPGFPAPTVPSWESWGTGILQLSWESCTGNTVLTALLDMFEEDRSSFTVSRAHGAPDLAEVARSEHAPTARRAKLLARYEL